MLNVGGGELLIIFLVALIVLGPAKLPEAARQIGKVMSEFRKISSGFQKELKGAMNDPLSPAALDRGRPDVVIQDSRPLHTDEDGEDTAEDTAEGPGDDTDEGAGEDTAEGPGDDTDEVEGPEEPDPNDGIPSDR